MKFLTSLILFLISNTLHGFEIIRDPIFENYFKEIQVKYNTPKSNVYLLDSNQINAFVLEDTIYFTTELLKNIKNEVVLKEIYFHEAGHLFYNHYNSKKNTIEKQKRNRIYNHLLSIGAAIISGNTNVGIATNITLDQSKLNKLSKKSIRFEIEADNYMLEIIKDYNLSTNELINFFKIIPDSKNHFFKSHPSNKDRIIALKGVKDGENNSNSLIFEWLKAKYNKNSNINEFNIFFQGLNEGKIRKIDHNDKIKIEMINYEIFKSGMLISNINKNFKRLIEINSNSYLKIEFSNYIIDNSLNIDFQFIEKYKRDKEMQDEFFFYLTYGKYYDKINEKGLSNFYFCQFYKLINLKDKSNYFCKKYDIKDIPAIDKSYALFK